MIESRGALVPTGSAYGTTQWTGSSLALGGAVHLGDINLTHLFRRLSYAEMFRRHPAIFTVVDKLGDLTARLPLKVYARGDQGRDERSDSSYAELLRRPNRIMSRYEFWKRVSVHYDLYGEAIVAKIRQGDTITDLWPINPVSIEIEWDERGNATYIAHNYDDETRIAPADVVHFKRTDPENPWRGLSPLEPLRATLDNTDAARAAMASFWRRGARPGTALVHPGTLSQDAANRLKSQFDSIAAGAGNTGATVVFEEGMEPKVLSLSAEEAQYIQTRKYDDREVFAAFHMPPTAVGDLEFATYSNVTENLRSVYRDTVAPRVQAFESTLAHQLSPDFPEELYAEFVMDEVLRGDFEQRATAYQQGINAGWLMPAEVRQRENLPFVEGSDVLMANSTMRPVLALQDAPVAPLSSTRAALSEAWKHTVRRIGSALERRAARGQRLHSFAGRGIAIAREGLALALRDAGADTTQIQTIAARAWEALETDLRSGRPVGHLIPNWLSEADGWADDVLEELENP